MHCNLIHQKVSLIDKQLRPLQRSYFSCCVTCTDDVRPSEEVGRCVQQCVDPVSRVTEQLQGAQEAFQQRMKRCHQVAGEAVPRDEGGADGQPSAAAMAAYTARLRPCFEEELGKLDSLLAPVHAALPRAMEDLRAFSASAGSGSGRRTGVEVGEGKKSWW